MYKSAQKHTKNTSSLRKKGLFFATCFLLIVSFLKLQKSLIFSPYNRINVALIRSSITVISFPKKDTDFIIVVKIPRNLIASVPNGYDEYQISALKKLTEIEKKPFLMKDTISDLLAIPIHTQIFLQDLNQIESENSLKDLLICLYKSLLAGCQIEGLSFVDKINLLSKLSGKSKIVDFDIRNYAVENKLPDGEITLKLQQTEFDRKLELNLIDEAVRAENIAVTIQNHTDTPNVGKLFARFVSNMGGKIITINNDSASVAHCEIHGKEGFMKKKLVSFLISEFGCVFQSGVIDVSSELLISVGDSFGKRWQRTGL